MNDPRGARFHLPLACALAVTVSACGTGPGRGPRATLLPAPVVDLPCEYVGNLFLVQVMVEGHGPFACLLDTGTDRMLLDTATAASLGRAGTTEQGRVRGATGAEMPFRGLLEVAELRLGEAVFRGISTGIVDLAALGDSLGRPIQGILGCDVFAACTVQLDYAQHTVRLLQRPPDNASGSVFRFTETVPWVEATIAGRPRRLLLDTGFQRQLAVNTEADLPWRRPPRHDGEVVTVTGSQAKAVGRLQGRVEVGSLVLTNPDVTIAPGSPKLGAAALRGCLVTLDMAAGRVLLQPR
jgi:Aspartyl protease